SVLRSVAAAAAAAAACAEGGADTDSWSAAETGAGDCEASCCGVAGEGAAMGAGGGALGGPPVCVTASARISRGAGVAAVSLTLPEEGFEPEIGAALKGSTCTVAVRPATSLTPSGTSSM